MTVSTPAVSAVARLERQTRRSWVQIRKAARAAASIRRRLSARLAERGLTSPDAAIVVFGSLARGEFTSGSDLDWTLLVDGMASPEPVKLVQPVDAIVKDIAREPSVDGAFGAMVFSHDLVHRIGGQDDSNRNTTQRILLLLESRPVAGADVHERVIRCVLKRYFFEDRSFSRDTAIRRTRHHVPRFLQNDFARYWRTMAIDFAHKVRARGGRGEALRTFKLRLSRKLIYASGLLTCFGCELGLGGAPGAEDCAEHDTAQCVMCYERLFRRSPLEVLADAFLRLLERTDDARLVRKTAVQVFDAYDAFLGILDSAAQRKALDTLAVDAMYGHPLYDRCRAISHRFNDGLLTLFFDLDRTLAQLTRFYGVF